MFEFKISDEEMNQIATIIIEREVKNLFYGDYGVAVALRDCVKTAISDAVKTAMKDEKIQHQIFDGVAKRLESYVKREMLAKILEKLVEEKEEWSSQ